MTKRVALIGAGNIGGRLVGHLVNGGHRVVVHDPDGAAGERARVAGAQTVASVAEAARGTEIVLLSLPNPKIVEAVTTRILNEDVLGRVIVDHSTIDPATVRRLAKRASANAAEFLDAPVSGGTQGADAGTLSVMVGGAETALQKAAPVLKCYAANVFHVGQSGSGQALKLANNQITAAIIAALGEGLSAAVSAGVDLNAAVEVLTTSSANSTVLSGYFPKTLFTEERPTRFALDLMHKDLGLFLESASRMGLPTPVTNVVRDLFSIGQRDGRGNHDFTSVVEFYEDFTGIRLRTAPAEIDQPVGAEA
ncbi:NAD(P)-dependent oxidoreductase [Mycobacterium sp. smrl_JER01]|uniref:NAD(P)-dependent oxidoreductase n=1 Tax=Mycobacterium sp. smrl_JER01 TaxID=3402633 RepID=UPI003AD4E0A9